MKNICIYFVLVVLVSIVFFTKSFAQVSEGGEPLSFTKKFIKEGQVSAIVPAFSLPLIDNVSEFQRAEQIKKECSTCKKEYYGTGIDVDIDLKSNAISKEFDDGSKLWLYKFKSESALSLSFYFDRFYLPTGAKLFFYNVDRSMVLGAFTSKNNSEIKKFATQPISGKEIIIEYYEPFECNTDAELHINKVIHDFRGIFIKSGPYGNSGVCEVDANCPDGYGWEKEIRSVAIVLYYDQYSNLAAQCSGTLLNNQLQNGAPYFLTAYHCQDGTGANYEYWNWVFLFNHQTLECGGNGLLAQTTQSVSGATYLIKGQISDYLWLQLNSTPPTAYNVCYAGWDNTAIYPSGPYAGIHHPAGDVKKISFENHTVTLVNNPSYPYTNSHWQVSTYEVGSTSQGSSGSALFNSAHRLIGSLTAGGAECSTIINDKFGRFDVTYTDGSLNYELDPSSTGITSLNTYCPTNYCGNTTLTSSSGTITDGSGANDYPNMSNCKWLIQPSAAGVNSITLNFSSFNTESSYDKVIVYDGPDYYSTVLGTFSGTSLPTSVTSSGCEMFIRFVSDESVAASGWSATYTANIPCTGTTTKTAASGTITDGSGSKNYGCSANCKWLIQPPGATSITLDFTAFNTESGYDFVKVYNGPTTASPLLGSYSGTSVPPNLSSTGGSMLIHFTADGDIQKPGWSATYSSTFAGVGEGEIARTFIIYPNPCHNQIMVEFNVPEPSDINLRIFNMLNQCIYFEQELNFQGAYQKQIMLNNYAKGVYTVELLTSQGKVIRKIIVE